MEVDGEGWIERSLFARACVVFFFVVGGPRREEVIVCDVRWVPGPGENFEKGARGWPGRERVGRDILSMVLFWRVVCDWVDNFWCDTFWSWRIC